jgi:hypothetical protein
VVIRTASVSESDLRRVSLPINTRSKHEVHGKTEAIRRKQALTMCETKAEKGAPMPAPKSEGVLEAERIYDAYVKPIEHEHEGDYALVMADGTVYFGPDVLDLADKAMEKPSRKNLFFKVKDIAVYTIL